MKRLLACAALLATALSAHAGIVTADFRTEGNLFNEQSQGPKVFLRETASVGAGVELDGIDYLASNPSDWSGGEVWMDLDPMTNILTLSARDGWDFAAFRASLGNIVGGTVVGIEQLSNTLTVQTITPTLGFSDNSVWIAYESPSGEFTFNGENPDGTLRQNSASFQLLLAPDAAKIPEPGSLALLGLAGAMLGLARRRKRA